MSPVPTLDMATIATPRFAAHLLDGLHRTGFVVVTGHGVPRSLIEVAFETAAALFALPEDDKMRCAGGLRGFTPFGVEHAKDTTLPDLKEFWQVGHARDGLPGSAWPAEVPEARAVFEALFAHLFTTGSALLAALAKGLGMPADFFTRHLAGGSSLLRVLHYPPLSPDTPTGSLRSAPHEDINLMTLMPACSRPGLQIRLRDGRWVPVEPPPGALIVDTGDMMARWSGGRLPATTHRVVNPSGVGQSRYALPFFLQPRDATVLTGLPVTGPPLPPITAGELLQRRLAEIGLKM